MLRSMLYCRVKLLAKMLSQMAWQIGLLPRPILHPTSQSDNLTLATSLAKGLAFLICLLTQTI